VNSVSSVVD